jgi:hypothetical protein
MTFDPRSFTVTSIPETQSGAVRSAKYKKTAKGRRTENKYQRKIREAAYLARDFVAWDGEGVTRSPGAKQDYVLFASSRGARITSERYLSTTAILSFILKVNDPSAVNVIYGASYDWNMWLRDLPRETLEQLYQTGAAVWGRYWFKLRLGKMFHFGVRGTKTSALFYDVMPFFQRSFVKACDAYLGAEFFERELIVKNKMLRGDFTQDDLAEMTRYTDAELVNLVRLMGELRSRLHRVGLKVSRWDGPGAIAVSLFQRHGIKEHLSRTGRWMSHAVQSAYFGGRFEVLKTGYVRESVWEYDVNSAYPWALQDVPSMAGGRWDTVKGAPPDAPDFALYHLTYSGNVDHADFPQPFPFRRAKDGNVCYPFHTTGWYWGPEYRAGMAFVERWGGSITVHETRVFVPATDTKPFAFIGPIYTQRQKLKKCKDGAHVGIKLGLNSLYGKLAQQVGWRETPNGLRLPPYHQLEWAGYATSRCRAAVFSAILDSPGDVVAFETDAMFVRAPLNVAEGEELGQWESTEFTDMLYMQSGTYFAHEVDGTAVNKTRGVDRGELTFDNAYDALKSDSPTLDAKLTRFYGLGLALAQNFDKWLTWDTMTKHVKVYPTGKRVHDDFECWCSVGADRTGTWHRTYPYGAREGDVSAPFPLEWEDGELAGHYAKLRRQNVEGVAV